MDDHNHSHHHSESNLKVAFFLNAAFALIEVAGGILTNSMAVLTDAFHDAGDTAAIGIAWYFQRVSSRKRDNSYTFGYKRFNVLGALINALILFTGSCIILFLSIPRLLDPREVNEQGMVLLALLGLAVNLFAMWKVKQGKTQNEQVISLHLLEDVLGWIAVLAGGVVLHFYNIPILDPLLSIGIAAFMLYRVAGSIRSTLRIFLQGTPAPDSELSIKQKILGIHEVTGVHDIHLWTMDGNFHVATLHLEVEQDLSLEETATLKNKVRNLLLDLHIEHATLEIELKGQSCLLDKC